MAKVPGDLTGYATKAPSDMHVRFADWILEQTGYDPAKAKSKDEAFRAGVALGAYLRPTFQRSEDNHTAWKESGKATPGTTRKAAPAKKATKAAPVEEPDADDVEAAPRKVAKAAPGRRGPVKAGGVKKAVPRKGAKPAEADTPF